MMDIGVSRKLLSTTTGVSAIRLYTDLFQNPCRYPSSMIGQAYMTYDVTAGMDVSTRMMRITLTSVSRVWSGLAQRAL